MWVGVGHGGEKRNGVEGTFSGFTSPQVTSSSIMLLPCCLQHQPLYPMGRGGREVVWLLKQECGMDGCVA